MSTDRLAEFVREVENLVATQPAEDVLLQHVRAAMEKLVAIDDWLPARFAEPDPTFYRQFLLYADPTDRFSVVSFVWGPGQRTPIHDHCTWGVVGMLRGAEITTSYVEGAGGIQAGVELTLRPGDVTLLSPGIGDIHMVRNAYADRVSISIHAYGANIGKQTRHVFDPVSGERKTFVSGYSKVVQ